MTTREILVRIQHAMKISEFGLAEQLLKKLLSVKPNYHPVHMLFGNVCERTGRLDEAEAYYLESIRLKPDNIEALNNLGVVYKNQRRYEDALSFFIKALTIDPHRADIYYNIGNTYRDSGNPENAAGQYEKAIKLNPGFIHAYTNLGMLLEKQGKDDEAAYVYMQGLGIDYNNPGLHYNLGVIFERQGKPENAKKEYELALKAKPGWTDAMLNLGVVLSKLREHDKSIENFRTILKIEPDNIKAINNLGTEYGKLKDADKAKSYYEKALSIDPDYGKAHMNLSSLFEDQGRLNDAVREIETLLERNQSDIEARLRLASLQVMLGKFRQAESGFRSILKDNPGHKETLRCLGNLYLRTGKYNAANKCYEELAQNHPDTEKFHLDFAVLLNDKKEFKKSEEEVKKFLSANPSDIDAESLLGELYFKQGDYDEAARLFEKIVEKNPNIVKPYYYLARTYKKTGNTEKALQTIDKLIAVEGAESSGYDIDNLNKAIKLYENATKEYEKAFKITLGKDLMRLEDFRFDEETNGKSGENNSRETTDAIYPADAAAAIIKTAGTEPVIPVKEKIEQIRIVEIEQESPAGKTPDIVELKDKEAPPLSDLLNNEDLYDDMQNLKARQAAHDKLMKQLAGKEKNQETEGSGASEPDLTDYPAEKKKKTSKPFVKQDEDDDDIDADEPAIALPAMKQRAKPKRKMRKEKRFSPPPFDVPDDTIVEIPGIVNTDIEVPEQPDTPADKILDFLKNISDKIKAKTQFKPLPLFNLMPHTTGPLKKKEDENRENDKQQADDRQSAGNLSDKSKTTRQKLKEYFGSVRKKLDEESGIKMPENREKQKYIKKLVDKAIKETPLEKTGENELSVSAQDLTDKKQAKKKIRIGEIPENNNTLGEKKQNKKDTNVMGTHYMGKLAAGTASTDEGKKEIFIKKEEEDVSGRFLIYAQPNIGKIDPSRELILEEKIITQLPDEKKKGREKEKASPGKVYSPPENITSVENKKTDGHNQVKNLAEKKQVDKTIISGTSDKTHKEKTINRIKTTNTSGDIISPAESSESGDAKSFKPYIRMKKEGFPRSIAVTTLQFLRVLSVCIPGKKMKTRIRTKLDSMISNMK